MGKTDIQWTDWSWTPLRGCRRISPGCGQGSKGGCYAERMAMRLSGEGRPYHGLVKGTPEGPRWTGATAVDEETLLEPLSWRKPRRVFVCSMSDLFFAGFYEMEIARVYAVMARTPHITYQVLTKRAERAATLLNATTFRGMVANLLPKAPPWPLPNVWQGVSCEDRKHGLPRLEHLRRMPAAMRFVSFEPLLEDLGAVNLAGIHQAIIGGESGQGSRPRSCAAEWIRSLVVQARAQGCHPFVKQLGTRFTARYYDHDLREHYGSRGLEWPDPDGWSPEDGQPTLEARVTLGFGTKGQDFDAWPEEFRVRETPPQAPDIAG